MLVCGQVLLIFGVLPSSRVDRLNDVWSEQACGINIDVCQKVLHLCSIDSVKNVLFLPWICSNIRRCARNPNRNIKVIIVSMKKVWQHEIFIPIIQKKERIHCWLNMP